MAGCVASPAKNSVLPTGAARRSLHACRQMKLKQRSGTRRSLQITMHVSTHTSKGWETQRARSGSQEMAHVMYNGYQCSEC